jgi:hypothetical protein
MSQITLKIQFQFYLLFTVREHSKGKGVDAVQVELPLSVRTGSDQRREAIIQVEKTTFVFVFAANVYCIIFIEDEETLKTSIPKCRLYWSFLFGVVHQFGRF